MFPLPLLNNIQLIAAIAIEEELVDTLAFTSNFIPA